jgi:IPT/TIG domain
MSFNLTINGIMIRCAAAAAAAAAAAEAGPGPGTEPGPGYRYGRQPTAALSLRRLKDRLNHSTLTRGPRNNSYSLSLGLSQSVSNTLMSLTTFLVCSTLLLACMPLKYYPSDSGPGLSSATAEVYDYFQSIFPTPATDSAHEWDYTSAGIDFTKVDIAALATTPPRIRIGVDGPGPGAAAAEDNIGSLVPSNTVVVGNVKPDSEGDTIIPHGTRLLNLNSDGSVKWNFIAAPDADSANWKVHATSVAIQFAVTVDSESASSVIVVAGTTWHASYPDDVSFLIYQLSANVSEFGASEYVDGLDSTQVASIEDISEWVFRLPAASSQDQITAIALSLDDSNNSAYCDVLVAGYTHGEFAELSTSGPYWGDRDLFVFKLQINETDFDQVAQEAWRIQLGSSGEDTPFSIAMLEHNQAKFVGRTPGGVISFDTCASSATPYGTEFILTLDSVSGDGLSCSQHNLSVATSAAIDPADASVIFTGVLTDRSEPRLYDTTLFQLDQSYFVKISASGREVFRMFEAEYNVPYPSDRLSQTGACWTKPLSNIAIDPIDSSFFVTTEVHCLYTPPTHVKMMKIHSNGTMLWSWDVYGDPGFETPSISLSADAYDSSVIASYPPYLLKHSDFPFAPFTLRPIVESDIVDVGVNSLVLHSGIDVAFRNRNIAAYSSVSALYCALLVKQNSSTVETPMDVTYDMVVASKFAIGLRQPDVVRQMCTYGSGRIRFNNLQPDSYYRVCSAMPSDPDRQITCAPSAIKTKSPYGLPPAALPDWNFELAYDSVIVDSELDWSSITGSSRIYSSANVLVDTATSQSDNADSMIDSERFSVSVGSISRPWSRRNDSDPQSGILEYASIFYGLSLPLDLGYVLALNLDGQKKWEQYIPSVQLVAVAIDPTDDSTLCVGVTTSAVYASDTAGAQDVDQAANDVDMTITKFRSDGSFIWGLQPRYASDDRAMDVAIDHADSSIVVVGSAAAQVGGYHQGSTDVLVIKFSSAGAEIWQSQTGTSAADVARSVAISKHDSSILVAGYTAGAFSNVDGNQGGVDMFVMKLDSDGTEIWRLQFGSSADDFAISIAISDAEYFGIAGYTSASMFGNEHLGSTDIIVAKFNTTSRPTTPIWSRQIGTASEEEAHGIRIDTSSNTIVIVGNTTGSLFTTSYGGADIVVFALSSDTGDTLQRYQTGTSQSDCASAVAVDWDHSVLVVGYRSKLSDWYDDIVQRRNNPFYGMYVMKMTTNSVSSDPNQKQLQVTSTIMPEPMSVNITLELNLQLTRPNPIQVCILAIPAWNVTGVAELSAIPRDHVLDASYLWHYPPFTQQACSAYIQFESSSRSRHDTFALVNMQVATNYSVIAIVSATSTITVFEYAFTTAPAAVAVTFPLQVVSSVMDPFSAFEPKLEISVSGNPRLLQLHVRPYFGFNLSLPATSPILVPTSMSGSPLRLTSTLDLGQFYLHTDPTSTFSTGVHTAQFEVTAIGSGVADSIFTPTPPPWYFATSIHIRGKLDIYQADPTRPHNAIVTVADSDVPTIVVTPESTGNNSALVQFRAYPAPAAAVLVILSTTSSNVPDLDFFIAATDSQHVSTTPGQTQLTSAHPMNYQRWALTSSAYAASLQLTVLRGGDPSTLSDITEFPETILLQIRNIIHCHAIRAVDGSRLPLLNLYVGMSSASIPTIAVMCKTVLQFYTDSTAVQLSVTTPPALTVSLSQSGLNRQEGTSSSLTFSATQVGLFSPTFAASVISSQGEGLDASFFPINPDGYVLQVNVTAASSRSIIIPPLLAVRSEPQTDDDNANCCWSDIKEVLLSEHPLYNLSVTLVNPAGVLQCEPAHNSGSEPVLYFAPDGPLSVAFRCRAKVGTPPGQYQLQYIVGGTDAIGYITPAASVVSVTGSVSIAPYPSTLFLRQLQPPSRTLHVSGLPAPGRILSIAFNSSSASNLGFIKVVPATVTFTSANASRSVELGYFGFTGSPQAGEVTVSMVLSGSAAQYYEQPTPMRITLNANTASRMSDIQLTCTYQPDPDSENVVEHDSPVADWANSIQILSNITSRFTTSSGSNLFLPASSTQTNTSVCLLVAVHEWKNMDIWYGRTNTSFDVLHWHACNAEHKPLLWSRSTSESEPDGDIVNDKSVRIEALPVWQISCSVAALTGTNYALALVQSTLSGSSSQGLSVISTVGSAFSFPPPQIDRGSLRMELDGLGNTHVFASSVSASDIVYLDGSGFGSETENVNVTFGPQSLPSKFQCQMTMVQHTVLGCRMLHGSGINLVFQVSVSGQITVGSDLYSFPNPPAVESITGCGSDGPSESKDSEGASRGCSSMGATSMTIRGSFFAPLASAMTVSIGGKVCSISSIYLSSENAFDTAYDEIQCQLPSGSGGDLTVQISRVFGDVTLVSPVTESSPRLSYASPAITHIASLNCSSTSDSDLSLTNCPRLSGPAGSGNATLSLAADHDSSSSASFVLTIHGRHFGNSQSVIVIVGSQRCTSPRLSVVSAEDDTQNITCELAPGQETEQLALLLVPNGATSQSTPAFVSFEQCSPGMFEDDISGACIPCSRYEFQQSPGKPLCEACPTNQYKTSTDTTNALCTQCPDGATCGQRMPVASVEGHWLGVQRVPSLSLSHGSSTKLSSKSLAAAEIAQVYRCVGTRCINAIECFKSTAAMVATGQPVVSCCSENRVSAELNIMCGRCMDGYSEWGGTCVECQATNIVLVGSFMLLGVAILFALYHITSKSSGGTVKVIVVFAQTIHAFVASDPTFPSLAGAIASFDPASSSSSCLTPLSGIWQASLPLVQVFLLYALLSMIFSLNVLFHLVHRCIASASHLKFSTTPFIRVALAVSTMSFIPILKATVTMFKCDTVSVADGPGATVTVTAAVDTISVMHDFPTVICDSDEHKLARGVGLTVALFIGGIISLLVAAWGQRQYRQSFKQQQQQQQLGFESDSESCRASNAVAQIDSECGPRVATVTAAATVTSAVRTKSVFTRRFGFLFNAFRPTTALTASWQAMILVRSTCFVLASSLVDDWRSRFAFLSVLACIALVLHQQFRPFKFESHDNRLEFVSLSILVVVGFLNSTQWYDGSFVRGTSVVLYYGFTFCWLLYYIAHKWRSWNCKANCVQYCSCSSNSYCCSASTATRSNSALDNHEHGPAPECDSHSFNLCQSDVDGPGGPHYQHAIGETAAATSSAPSLAVDDLTVTVQQASLIVNHEAGVQVRADAGDGGGTASDSNISSMTSSWQTECHSDEKKKLSESGSMTSTEHNITSSSSAFQLHADSVTLADATSSMIQNNHHAVTVGTHSGSKSESDSVTIVTQSQSQSQSMTTTSRMSCRNRWSLSSSLSRFLCWHLPTPASDSDSDDFQVQDSQSRD